MDHIYYSKNINKDFSVCLLSNYLNKSHIEDAYLNNTGLDREELLVLSLYQTPNRKKSIKKEIVQYIEEELIPVFSEYNVKYILCSDSEYFKALTKSTKVEANLGYVLDCIFGPWKVIYVPTHKAIFYDPDRIRIKIQQGIDALLNHQRGTYVQPGDSIISFSDYPRTYEEISNWLDKLIEWDKPLAIDIECFSLKHYSAGIGTISFAWNQHEGIAFPVDYQVIEGATEAPYGINVRNEPVRKLLKNFFKKYLNTAYYHNISFDVYVLIYQLFMDDLLDTKGLLEGIDILLRNWNCTKLITYLATNSCAGNKLSLKDQAQEFAGNYAVESIEDITLIPLDKLLEYNLVDSLSTWFVKEKHWDTMVQDEQLDIYLNLFKPSIVDIIQMQLTGLPVNMETVKKVKKQLTNEENYHLNILQNLSLIKNFEAILNQKWVDKRNSQLKVKRVTLADAKEKFNPNSNEQLQSLLFDLLNLPVINLTKNKEPSTDGETIEALKNHTKDSNVLELLDSLLHLKVIGKLTSSFIPALEKAQLTSDGWHYLFGNFNLGGTLSGRLSSSEPNLQNLPSTGKGKALNAKYAKLIKSCFEAPPGWLFVGVDFSSLEDRISALTTKDPNKLKVYTDGFDGHSLRAFSYFKDKMPDIIDTVESINSIQTKYKPLRDRSKNPTFTLTYQGTYIALVKKYGFTVEEAKELEAKYHELYKVSDAWVNAHLDKAMDTGYVTCAFGLRLRTPLLKQVIRGTSKTPFEAEAEGRTAGNALGQSWCLLNSRAGNEFNAKVRSGIYKYSIRPCAQIHDAGYYIIKDDIDVLMYTNEHFIKAVRWQEHPDIMHDKVKLGGELSIFYPTWVNELVIPNEASKDQILKLIKEYVEKL